MVRRRQVLWEALRGYGDAQTRAGAGSAEHRRAKQQACASFVLDGNSEVGSEVGQLHETQWQFRLDRGRQRPKGQKPEYVLVKLLVLAKERRYSHTRANGRGKTGIELGVVSGALRLYGKKRREFCEREEGATLCLVFYYGRLIEGAGEPPSFFITKKGAAAG